MQEESQGREGPGEHCQRGGSSSKSNSGVEHRTHIKVIESSDDLKFTAPLCYAMQCNAIYCTLLYSATIVCSFYPRTPLHCIAPYCIVFMLCRASLLCSVLYCAELVCNTTLSYTAPLYSDWHTLHSCSICIAALHCTAAMHCTAPRYFDA